MNPTDPKNIKKPFKINGERVALLVGGIIIGALVLGFGFKMATPIVKKACQSILETPEKETRESRVASIEAVVVKPGTISKRITTVGKLRANEFVTLRAEMQGRIKELTFKEGSMVTKGDALIRFEDEELRAELVKAEADVEYRQVRYDRMVSLQSKGLTKGPDFDQERGQLNMAKAQLEVAKAKLEKATIYAPFDGKIGLIDVSVGAIVDGQKELVTIVDFTPMKIDFKIPEKFIHDIGVGQTAEIKLDSIPDQVFRASVEAVDSRVDPQTHSIAVRATTPNEDGKLQTGLFATVGVIIGVKNDALLVPESALGREGDIEYVWVVVNGKAGRKRVLTGTKENGQVEITAGLRNDEIVVISGQLKLGEGTAVKITNMDDQEVELSDEEESKKEVPSSPQNSGPAAQETLTNSQEEKSTKTDEKTTSEKSPATSETISVETPSSPESADKVASNSNQQEKPSTPSEKEDTPKTSPETDPKPDNTQSSSSTPQEVTPSSAQEEVKKTGSISELSFSQKTYIFTISSLISDKSLNLQALPSKDDFYENF